MLGHVLVERDGVAAIAATAHGAGGEDGGFGSVPAFDAGVGGAGDDGEGIADVLHGLEVRRGRVAGAFVLGDEVGIVEAEGEGHADEALGADGSGGAEGGHHGVEEGEGEGNAGLLEDGATGKGFAGGDVHDG